MHKQNAQLVNSTNRFNQYRRINYVVTHISGKTKLKIQLRATIFNLNELCFFLHCINVAKIKPNMLENQGYFVQQFLVTYFNDQIVNVFFLLIFQSI